MYLGISDINNGTGHHLENRNIFRGFVKPELKMYPHADSALSQTGAAEPIIMRQEMRLSSLKEKDTTLIQCRA